jgi:hypothetical protein
LEEEENEELSVKTSKLRMVVESERTKKTNRSAVVEMEK